jgi:hypothetical protein
VAAIKVTRTHRPAARGIATEPDDCRADVSENSECMPPFGPALSKDYVLRLVGAALPLQAFPGRNSLLKPESKFHTKLSPSVDASRHLKLP